MAASSAAVVALRDQVAGAASKIARLNELETIRQDVFVTATRAANEREAEAMNNVADRLALLVATKVPSLNPAKMSPEQRLVAELQLYKREEAERLSAIARHEDEIRAGQARLADAQREHSTVARQVLELKQQLRVREVRPRVDLAHCRAATLPRTHSPPPPQDTEGREFASLNAARETAITKIAAESDAEARRVLTGLEAALTSARTSAAASAEGELSGAESVILEALNTYAATCRVRVKAIAVELGVLASGVYEESGRALVERLEGQSRTNASAVAQLGLQRDRLARLYAAVLAGRDPGDDISGLVASFPLLPAEAGGGARGRGGPSSPGSSPTSPITTSPSTRASRVHSASHGGPSNPALVDVLGSLEARDAASFNTNVVKARKTLADLIDHTAARWAALECGSEENAIAFVRATHAALAAGSEPSLPAFSGEGGRRPTHSVGSGAGVDIAASYRAECESVGMRDALARALQRLDEANTEKAEAEAEAAKAGGAAARIDAAQRLSAAQGVWAAAKEEAASALAAFESRK
jgi:hypothetical protein